MFTSLTLLAAAQPAVPSAQECRGTLILESLSVITDTDPNPPWTRSDQWTLHVYAWQNGALRSFQDYSITGDSGYTKPENAVIGKDIPLGLPGGTATLKLELWTKEKDPKARPRGVAPADRGRIVTTRTETCAPGEVQFSVFNDVFANPTPPGPDEHDGRVELRWKWILEVV